MKILSIVMAYLFIANVSFASATVHDRVNLAFDRLNYELTVNWDQQNELEKDTMLNHFEIEINDIRNDGVSNAEIANAIESRLIDNSRRSEFRQIVTAMTNAGRTSEEITNEVMPLVLASQQTGAHYRSGSNDDTQIAVAAISIIVGVSILALIPTLAN